MTTTWIRKLLDEVTVHWSPPTRDGLGGYSSWPEPSQINARWEYNVGSYGPTINHTSIGTTEVARTSVWLDIEIVTDSYLWKGQLIDLESGATPETVSGAKRVVSVRNIRAIPTKNYLYKAFLDES